MSKKPKAPQPTSAELTDQLLSTLLPAAAPTEGNTAGEAGIAAAPKSEKLGQPDPEDPVQIDSEPEPTLVSILGDMPEEPTLPGFEVQNVVLNDDGIPVIEQAPSTIIYDPDGNPPSDFTPPDIGQLVREAASKPVTIRADQIPEGAHGNLIYGGELTKPLEGEIMRPSKGALRYESRIEILDAFQYPGNVVTAPEWVDRNWVGFADPDHLRNLPAGPCLRVPTYRGDIVICRKGDYVCRQSVKITDEESEIKLEVWEKGQFERLFFPTPVKSRAAA